METFARPLVKNAPLHIIFCMYNYKFLAKNLMSHNKKIIILCLNFLSVTEIRKVLSKISKEKGCEALAEWIKPCERHLHWSAT